METKNLRNMILQKFPDDLGKIVLDIADHMPKKKRHYLYTSVLAGLVDYNYIEHNLLIDALPKSDKYAIKGVFQALKMKDFDRY
jgi:hypothetical protein